MYGESSDGNGDGSLWIVALIVALAGLWALSVLIERVQDMKDWFKPQFWIDDEDGIFLKRALTFREVLSRTCFWKDILLCVFYLTILCGAIIGIIFCFIP